MRINKVSKVLVALVAFIAAGASQALDYPVRPVKLVHGFAAGGNADTVARVLAQEMSQGLGKPVVVEAKPGAGGNIAAESVAKSAADGYTLLLVTGGHQVSGALYKSLGYKTVESFEPISTVNNFPFLLVTRANSTDTSLAAVLRRAKAKPGAVSFGSAGVGTTQHLTGELLASMAGVEFNHVPYKGDSAALVGLLGGDIDFVVAPPTAVQAQIKAGKLKALAISGASRWKAMPEVQTVAESGVAGFDVRSWIGLATAAGTPRAVVDKLHAETQRSLQLPNVRSAIEAFGSEVRGSTPEEMRARMSSELERWTKVVASAKIEKQ